MMNIPKLRPTNPKIRFSQNKALSADEITTLKNNFCTLTGLEPDKIEVQQSGKIIISQNMPNRTFFVKLKTHSSQPNSDLKHHLPQGHFTYKGYPIEQQTQN